ncbi:hypothetical protein MHBO_001631 [Bonamia ostreae]|uniref:Uncharacterized protein n=1 Tax=Bonamia ostreae TaxID=126728 RepID=A0ABV2AJP0_9EUKA
MFNISTDRANEIKDSIVKKEDDLATKIKHKLFPSSRKLFYFVDEKEGNLVLKTFVNGKESEEEIENKIKNELEKIDENIFAEKIKKVKNGEYSINVSSITNMSIDAMKNKILSYDRILNHISYYKKIENKNNETKWTEKFFKIKKSSFEIKDYDDNYNYCFLFKN